MRTFLITLLISITSSFALFAENIYILYSSDCMDQLEYDQKSEGEDYYAYRINTNRDEHIILEVGKKDSQTLAALPTPFLGCYNGKFDQQLVRRINTNINNYFVVTPIGKKFEVRPISFASIYKKSGEWISYKSPKYSFRFNLIAGTIGENISQSSDAKVFFEGVLPEECYNSYLFRQFPNNVSKQYIDIKFIPEVGLINEQIGSTPGDNSFGNSSLVRVNKSKYKNYIVSLCGGKIEEKEPVSYTDERVRDQPGDLVAKGGNIRTQPMESLPTPPTPEYHTVSRGETLYGIARKYKVSVADIKKWNHKKSSSIKRGEKLRITNSITPASTTKMTAKSGQVTWDKDTKTKTPSRVVSKTVPVTTHRPGNSDSGTYHTVKSGETVAYLAMKYGYTEARFRKMNNLNDNAYLKVNQRVKVDDCPCARDTYSYSSSTPKTSKPVKSHSRAVPTSSEPVAPAPYYHPEFTKKGAPTKADFDDEPASYSMPTARSGNPEVKFNNEEEDKSISDYYYPSPVNKKRLSYPTPESKKMNEKELTAKGVSSEIINGSDGVKRKVHIVREGETLYRIARYYNIKVERIRKLNNLEPNEVLMPFQRLYID